MSTLARKLTGALLGISCMMPAAVARADQKQQCSAAYDATQSLRDDGKLLDARRQALACSNMNCAAFIRADCSQWLLEIDTLMPTVVFTAKDASGANSSAVRVILDGRVLLERLDGSAVPVDPGKHHVRFELAAVGALEKDFVVPKGKKLRQMEASFENRAASPAPSAMPPAHAPAPSPPPGQGVTSAIAVSDVDEGSKRSMGLQAPASAETTIPTWAWFSGGAGLGVGAIGAMLILASKGSGTSASDGGRITGIMLMTAGSLALAGGVLGGIFDSSSTSSAPGSVSFAPVVTPTGGGLFAHGVF